jgi:hypothetical protein
MHPDVPVRARHTLHVFIVSGDHPQKSYKALDQIAPDLNDGDHVTVLSGVNSPDLGDLREFGPRVTFRHFPGESVWHLRARLPTMAGSFDWVSILEDHNLPLPDWPSRLRRVLAQSPDDVSAVFGATSNLTSTGKWSWANYLAIQAFHWTPQMWQPAKPLPFNLAIRTRLLPTGHWKLGEYETTVIASLMPHAVANASFPVDHIQHREFPGVLAYHWANGRATGAFMRTHAVSKTRSLLGHLAYVLVIRPTQSEAAINRHPLRVTLPAGTFARTYVLALAHACGAAFGFFAGPGDSPWRLE